MAQASTSDIEARARSGSAEAFAVLDRTHQAPLRRFLRRLLRDLDQADDIAHECFVTAWQRIDRIRPDQSFQSSLYTIAWGKARNARRGWLRNLRRDQTWSETQALEAPRQDDDRLSLSQALMELPLDRRAVLILCLMEDYSHEEVSRILQMPLGTVKSHLNKARQSLTRALAPELARG